MEKIYIVLKTEKWDGETWDCVFGAYRNEEDAEKRVREEADKVRPDWEDDMISEDGVTFSAWRDEDYDQYHCEIYIEETELI